MFVLLTKQLAKSAHLGEKLLHGPYKGLSKDESAIEVATIIQEQLNILEGTTFDDHRIINKEFIRNGLGSTGVMESIASGVRDFDKAQKLYSEVVDGQITACERSDLSDPASFMLYASKFDDIVKLETADQIFLQANETKAGRERRWPASKMSTTTPIPFVKKAARLGIAIEPYNGKLSDTSPSIVKLDPMHEIPSGFEQINEDLYSRTDNKFMVFNGAGVESWSGSHSITKISDPLEILLSTLG